MVRFLALPLVLGCAGLVAAWAGVQEPAGTDASARALDAEFGAEFEQRFGTYLERHCVLCHSGPEPESDLDLSRLSSPSELARDEGLLLRIEARIERQEMPPFGPVPPSAEEDANFLRALRELQARSWSPELPASLTPAPLRRLDRFELRRVLLDLTGVAVDPERLPVDGLARGWTHAGDGQWLTPLDLERWILALEDVARAAVPPLRGADRSFGAEALTGGYERGDVRSLSSRGSIDAELPGLEAGRYRITVEAAADQAGPDLARFALRWNGANLAEDDVPGGDGERSEHVFELELEPADGDGRLQVVFLNDYYDPEHEDRSERDRNLHVAGLRLEGPLGRGSESPFLDAAGGLERLEVALGAPPDANLLDELLAPLAERAWRGRTEHLPELRAALLGEPDLGSALRAGLVELLAAPEFLFVELPSPTDTAAHDAAARLSLFLWGRLPDDALLAAARTGALDSEAGLLAQAERLLRHPFAESLVQRLADRWLGLAAFESTAAEAGVDPGLRASMRRETELLLSAVLREDWPIETLIDAPFTHVNATLAEHYGLRGLGLDDRHRRVPLGAAARRGLLGHASILTLTSEPSRTSAVRRGKWVLETLLDTAPPPPPPDVGSLDAVAAGPQATLADRLALHRASASCAGCHARMDAIGLDFEAFGPRGRLVQPDGGTAALARIEALATPPAAPFRPSLRRSAVQHLAELALARPLTPGDRPWLGAILLRLERGPATLRQAVLAIVASEAFRSPPVRRP